MLSVKRKGFLVTKFNPCPTFTNKTSSGVQFLIYSFVIVSSFVYPFSIEFSALVTVVSSSLLMKLPWPTYSAQVSYKPFALLLCQTLAKHLTAVGGDKIGAKCHTTDRG